MGDFKSKLPDFKEISSIAGKLFKDVKTSVSEIIDDYKKKRAEEQAAAAAAQPKTKEPKPAPQTKPAPEVKPAPETTSARETPPTPAASAKEASAPKVRKTKPTPAAEETAQKDEGSGSGQV